MPGLAVSGALGGPVNAGVDTGVTATGGDPSAAWNMAVTKAQFDGVGLRLEGQDATPNASITVDGVAIGNADAQGKFKIEVQGFIAPASCQIAVSDGVGTRVTILDPCDLQAGGAPAGTTADTREEVDFQMTDTGLIPGAVGSGKIELRTDKVPAQLRLQVTATGTSTKSGTVTEGVLEDATYSLCLDGRVMASALAIEDALGGIQVSLSVQEDTSLDTISGALITVSEGESCNRAILEARIGDAP